MTLKSKCLFLILSLTLLISYQSIAQKLNDTTASLIRFKEGKRTFYKIPMTKFCFVREAGLKRKWPAGWVMKWEVVKKANSNLLFMEMNSTDVEDWLGNENVSGSVQLVFELPEFTDNFYLKDLSYNTKGLSIINNYSGGESKREYITGDIKIIKSFDTVLINSFINLITVKPNTKQQFIFTSKPVQSYSFEEYQEYMNKRDSIRDVERDEIVSAMTEAILTRDSIWKVENNSIADSLRQHPYEGPFRFWVSDIDKAEYSRTTYSVTGDSLVIKEGPYDFIYLAKNYSGDSVYFKRALTKREKILLAAIETKIGSDTLKDSYNNFCIMDGLILSFSFESAKFTKDLTVSNYYNESIAAVVDFINKITPKRYRLWYDKLALLKSQNECGQ